MLEVDVLADRHAFARVAADWDRLALAQPDPFATHAWLEAWWKGFAPDRAGAVLVAREAGELVGGLALLRGGAAMSNDHTPVFRPLAADDEARTALLGAAIEVGGGSVTLPALPADDPAAAGRRTISVPQAISPIVETTGTFEDWRAISKKRWGAPLERFRRKMAREHDLRLVVNESPDDLERELAAGFAVEGSGWKGRDGTAILSRPETERFYRTLAAVFHARGQLACSSLELDGRCVAWDLSLLYDGRVFLLKTGFDEEFRRFAPGLVLRLSVIEDCFERGYVAHELLGHVDDWKPKFATTERRHVVATIHGGAIGYLPAAALGATKRVRRRLRARS